MAESLLTRVFKVCVCFTLILLCLERSGTDAANILMIGNFGKGSHFLSLVPVGRSLLKQGHNVTFLISEEYSFRAKDAKYSEIFKFEIFRNDPDYSVKAFFQKLEELGFSESGSLLQFYKLFSTFSQAIVKTCDSVLEDEAMMKRFETLDAIVADIAWPCSLAIKGYLRSHSRDDPRLILTAPTTVNNAPFDTLGSPYNPAYQPFTMTGFTSSMSFIQRVINTLSLFSMRVFVSLMGSEFQSVLDKHNLSSHMGGSDPMASWRNMTDLFLISCDFAMEFPFPLTPNIIPVGGLTAGPAKDLSKDLNDFMESSGEHGVVVFTLGSYFASYTSVRPDVLKTFLDALARIPQKVIIQLKDTPSIPLPPNVKAMPWLPQNDLLGHPKTRLFMYHGGNNGFHEALYHGVPVIVIPFFGDHVDIMVRVTSRGMGLGIDRAHLSVDYVYRQMNEVLTNQTYRDRAKQLSAIFKDRPMAPADRAAFWINHVIKHGGDYMRSPVNDFSFVQYHLLDVFSFLLGIVCLTMYLSYKFLRLFIRCCVYVLNSLIKVKQD
ncbi:UDP-glucuronosyltransferase 2C1-like [Diadema antillarum]|uniref:UDP-glucuronosyltransferase 2C1-like n=1 Tax=Diadema antillarum TaxID=105358 RepID=UPI003A85E181